MNKLILTILLFLIPCICQADITTGLVGWWKFDEASSGTCSGTTADSSGQGNTGTCTNSPTYVTGKLGIGAINFNGTSNYITLGQTGIPGRVPVTVSAWVNFPMTGDSTIVERWDEPSGFKYGWLMTTGTCYAMYAATSEIASVNYSPPSGWHMLTCAVDTDNIPKAYIDGSLTATGGDANFTSSGAGDTLSIGAREISGTPLYSGGSIDDLRIYNRALSAADVTELYNYTGINASNPPFVAGNLTVTQNGHLVVQ